MWPFTFPIKIDFRILSTKSIHHSYLETSGLHDVRFWNSGDIKRHLIFPKNNSVFSLIMTLHARCEKGPSFLSWDKRKFFSVFEVSPVVTSDKILPSSKSNSIHLLTISLRTDLSTHSIWKVSMASNLRYRVYNGIGFYLWWPLITFELHQKRQGPLS